MKEFYVINVCEVKVVNQFGFVLGRPTIEAIYILRLLMEKYIDRKKDLHMILIDLKKAYDRVPMEVLRWPLEKNEVTSRYIDLIQNIYDSSVTSIKICKGRV